MAALFIPIELLSCLAPNVPVAALLVRLPFIAGPAAATSVANPAAPTVGVAEG